MEEKCIYKLKVDIDFKQLIPPLSAEELYQLEQNIIRDGCREPLCVWYNTILDGHNRYEICIRHQIPFAIQRVYPKNREEATVWICTNQLGRQNIAEESRIYLIGKRYEMEKILGAHNVTGINPYTKKDVRPKMLTEPKFDKFAYRTSERICEEYHICHATVDKYGRYANAIDSLSSAVPELIPKILSGDVKIPHNTIIELSRMPIQDIRRSCQQISDGTVKFVGYADTRKAMTKTQIPEEKLSLATSTGSVKDMPDYDPDAEISSLTLTIPSWVSSIDRARSVTNPSKITENARRKLEIELLGLRETIDSMLTAIKEEI